MPGDPRELGGDLGGWQDEVDGSRHHGAVRHAGVLRRSLVLGERHAPRTLDRAKATGPIGPGARKNHADRSRALVVGQRGQEGVDRQVPAVGLVARAKAKNPARYRQTVVGRNHVDMIGLDRRAGRPEARAVGWDQGPLAGEIELANDYCLSNVLVSHALLWEVRHAPTGEPG